MRETTCHQHRERDESLDSLVHEYHVHYDVTHVHVQMFRFVRSNGTLLAYVNCVTGYIISLHAGGKVPFAAMNQSL